MMHRIARATSLLLLAACSPSLEGNRNRSDGGADTWKNVAALAITPASADLISLNGASATAAFAATATYSDGHKADVTSLVAWSIGDAALGSVDAAGRFTGIASRGGATTVGAAGGGQTASAKLTVKVQLVRSSTDDGSTAPADSAQKFAGADNAPGLAAPIAYPLDGALVPKNLGTLEVQWRSPAQPADLYELSASAPLLDLRIYTNAKVPGGSRQLLSPAEWTAVQSAAAGGSLTIKVRALLSSAPSQIGASLPVKLGVGIDDVNGGIYYWSASGGNGGEGVFRHAFGDTTSMAKPFFSQADGNALFADGQSNHCVACHVLSHDGTKCAVTFNGGDGVAGLLDVASRKATIPPQKMMAWNFASMSPDGKRMVVAKGGKLSILDVDVNLGAVLQALATGGWGTHPDWSPDGKHIVYVRAGAPSSDWDFQQGSLVIATDGGGGFDAGAVLVASKGENNYYPSFSPDGEWVLFNRAPSGSAYNNPGAQPFVVSSDGKIGPLPLTAASGAGALTNSWPRWSPFVLSNGPRGKLLYLTFSSKRDYGIELVGVARPQVWMAAFDPTTAGAGTDPSYPPFWLPFQDATTSNHIAQWTSQLVGVQ